MIPSGVVADSEGSAYFFICKAFGYELQYLVLSRGQVRSGHSLGQAGGDVGRKIAPFGNYNLDGLKQAILRSVFEDVTVRTRAHGLVDIFIGVETRKQNSARWVLPRIDRTHSVQAAHARHTQIHKDHVGRNLIEKRQRL